MIKALLKIVAGSLLIVGVVLGLSFMSLQDAGAQNPKAAACQGTGGTWKPDPNAPSSDPNKGECVTPDKRTVTGTIKQVGNVLIFIVGAVSVLMVIIGGMRYALAQGDSNAVSSAKNTVLYAIIGIVLSLASYGLVNFVISNIT